MRIERHALLQGLKQVGRAVSRGVHPVYESVLVTIRSSEAVLKTTNLETWIETVVGGDADLTETGETSLAIPHKELTRAVQLTSAEHVELRLDPDLGAATLSGSGETRFLGEPAEHFPETVEFQSTEHMECDAAAFADAVNRVDHAISRERLRFALDGARIFPWEGRTRIEATDGRRMAWVDLEHECGIDAIMSPQGLRAIATAIAAEAVETIALRANASFVEALVGRTRIGTRVVDGNWPQTESVKPARVGPGLVVDCGEMIAALKRCDVVTSIEAAAVSMSCVDSHLRLRTRSARGEATEMVRIVKGDEPLLRSAFNPGYLREALEQIRGEQVRLTWDEGASLAEPLKAPLAMRSADDETDTYREVLMPVSVEHYEGQPAEGVKQ